MMEALRPTMGICEYKLERRSFIKVGILIASTCFAPRSAIGAIRDYLSPERKLHLVNLHTGESLKTVYWSGGKYLSKALTDIDHVLRDHRTGEIRPIDTRLLDLLYVIGKRLETQRPFHIISGYRSPATNSFLRKKGYGVARHSLHMQGKAVDIRMPACDLSSLRHVAIALREGGVGYYPRANFVHVDVGRVRYW